MNESEAVIEIQGPDDVQQIPMCSYWTMQDVTRIAEILRAAGYTQVAPLRDPQTGAVFAFGPSIEPAEQDVFDNPDRR